MTDPITITLQITAILEHLGIPYFIGGSLAGILYGEYRTTNDVDIIAAVNRRHIPLLINALADDFYIHDAEIELAIDRHNHHGLASFNCIHHATGFKIDIFLPPPRLFEQSEFHRRTPVVLSPTSPQRAYVASPEDMILAKLEWSHAHGIRSDQQWRDVLAIVRIQGDTLDQSYLQHWADQLGIRPLLDRAFRAVASEHPD